MASNVISGALRISGPVSVFTTIPFSALVTTSAYNIQNIQIANGVSDFIVSIGTFSSPGFTLLLADQIVRVNFGNLPSSTSHASAGYQFKDMWAQIGSGISGPLSLHFANSSGQTASVTIVQGM